MIVKLLNGELIHLDTHDMLIARKTVADMLDVYWSQVRMVKDLNEDHNSEYVFVMILDKPVITFSKYQLTILKDWTHNSCDWSTFVNPDIIQRYMQCIARLTNWANPHPIVVDYILKNHPKISRSSRFFANPAEPIVDRILEYLEETKNQPDSADWSKLSMNPNPRIIETMIDNFPRLINTNHFGLHNNDKAVDFAWANMMSTTAKKHTFLYSVANNKQNDRSIQYQLDCVSERMPLHVEHMMRVAPGHSHPRILEWLVAELDEQFQNLQMSQSLDIPVTFISNPNPVAVDWLFAHFSLIENDQRYLKYFCRNAHDKVVNWFLDHPDRIKLSEFLCNPNPLAVEYIKQSRPLYNKTYWELILKNPNVDLFVWAWHEWFAFTEDMGYLMIEVEQCLAHSDKVSIEYAEDNVKM